MLQTLLISALLMGLAGGPHCLAMCGSACMGVSRMPGNSAVRSLLLFQAGRLAGYAGLGAVAAESMNALGWLAQETKVLHPLWSMLHIAAVLWGLWLIWRAEQPLWLSRTAQQIWQLVSGRAAKVGGRNLSPLWLGMAWSLLPCGLLYSALLVAMFTAGALQGAMVMAAFAIGGGLMLTVFPWCWSHISDWTQVHINWNLTPIKPMKDWQNLGTRVSGLMLAVTAAWGLYSGLTHSVSPWCWPGWNS